MSTRATDVAMAMSGDATPSPNGPAPWGGASIDETWVSLRDLLERPELLEPPEEVVPRIGFRDRATLVSAPDKAGKTTLVAHASAAVTRGRQFLDGRAVHGRCVWCGLEEALGDAVLRFRDLNADPDRMKILTIRPPDLLLSLDSLLSTWPADYIAIDSLIEWARAIRGAAPEDGDASAWGTVIRPLVQLAREHHVAMSILHHPRRSDGQYRGSLEIAAAVDCLWEMLMPGDDEPDRTIRRFRGRARWPVEPWSLRMVDGRYELGGSGPVSLDVRVVADAAENPGTSKSAQRGRLKCGKGVHDAAVHRLVAARELVIRGGRGQAGSAIYLPGDTPEDVL